MPEAELSWTPDAAPAEDYGLDLPPPARRRFSPLTAGLLTAGAVFAVALGFGKHLSSRIDSVREARSAQAQRTRILANASRASAAASRIVAQARPQAAPQAESVIPAAPAIQAAPLVSDSIRASATAPERQLPPRSGDARPAPLASPAQDLRLHLQARKEVRALELRSGPGAEFPLVGRGDLRIEYPVLEWKDRWFRISLDDTGRRTAWVHYDKIELLSEDTR